jgi:uncharacterized protein YjbJ (UPF0337 family)
MSEPEAPSPQAGDVFKKVAGKAKKAVGRLLGNDDLAVEGELQEAQVETSSQAARLAADADQRQREADLAAQVDSNRVEQERIDAQLLAEQREAQIERENEAAQAAVDQEFARRGAQVTNEAHRQDEVIHRRERVAEATRLEGALDAEALAQEADRAAATAEALQDAQHELERHETGE